MLRSPHGKLLIIMNLTAVFILLLCLQVSATVHSQQKISLSVENIKLSEALSKIQKQTEYRFVYHESRRLKNISVSINVKDASLQTVMDILLQNTGYSYSQLGNNLVAIGTTEKPLRPVTGSVTNSRGDALVGVSVMIKGSNTGTTTNAQGQFSLNIPEGAIIVITYVGYKAKEISVGEESNLQVILDEIDNKLDDVVVVGYGKQSRNKITGAVSSISGDEIRKMPVTNNLQSLAGRIPGLISLNSSGRPGSGSSVSIRGISSYNNAPALYVIDGTIRTSDNFAQLDPSEIESISVLKDAGSAAVYGVRATNGVIVVITKRGKSGKPLFSLSSSTSFDQPTIYPRLLSAYEFAVLKNEAATNMGSVPLPYTAQQLEDIRTGKTPTANWQDVTYGDHALTQQHNFSVNGGSEVIQYFLSFGYTDQKGIYDNLGYKRYNFRANTDIKITNTLTAAANMEGRFSKYTSPNIGDTTLFQYASIMLPDWVAYYPDGRPASNPSAVHPGEVTKKSGYNNSDQNLFIGQLSLTQQIPVIKGLSATGSMQVYRDYSFNKAYNLQFPVYTEDADGNVTNVTQIGNKTALNEGFVRTNSYTLNLSMNYSGKFYKHTVSGLILYEQFQGKTDNFNGSRTNFPFTSVDQLFAGGNDDERTITGSATNDGRLGIVGRVNYDFDSKYLLELAFREDASYRFAANRRWGFFPSVSAGWVLSKEKFFRELTFVDNLKLRASYGILGNDIVGGFQYKSSYSISGDYYFNETPFKYLVPGVLPNPDITWESTATTNIGLDASLWNRLLGITLDVFQKNTYDIYATRTNQYPGVFGATLPAQNYGKVDARGFEIVLTHNSTIGDFIYGISANFSYSRNKVREIDYNTNIEPWNNPIGKPIGYTTGYKALGLYQSDEDAATAPRITGTAPKAGDIKYQDLNKDGIIDSRDMTILSFHGATPEIMYGMNIDLGWKNFSLNVFLQGVGNRTIMYTGYTRNVLQNGNSYNYFLDRWTPDNPSAEYPRTWSGRNPVNDVNSSFWFKSANFLRVKNVQLAYSLPKFLTSKAKLSTVRFYVNLVNFYVFSKQKDFDPEFPGSSGFYYPQNKSLIVGANISF
ncbi:MAG: hypothetical protein BGP14_16995 [Sphingobacteriales bacterium 44-15]|nr:MAG: hypothetical protein BGP14_16995 [Sphingobacteriales bacterium 44-15]